MSTQIWKFGTHLPLSRPVNIWLTNPPPPVHVETTQPANIGPQNVPRSSPSSIPRASPKDPIWPSQGDPNLTSGGRLIWRPGDVLKWHPVDVLIWRWSDVPGRLIREVPRTFSGCPLEDLQNTQTWRSQLFFELFFQNLFDWPNLSKSISTLKVYWEPSETSKMEHFLQN